MNFAPERRLLIIKAAKRIFNSDKICRSYCDFYFGVTFLEHSVVTVLMFQDLLERLQRNNELLDDERQDMAKYTEVSPSTYLLTYSFWLSPSIVNS